MGRRLLPVALLLLAAGAAGCAGLPGALVLESPRFECERQGGWWRGDDGLLTYCEYQSEGFL